jgi:hypothetical protein
LGLFKRTKKSAPEAVGRFSEVAQIISRAVPSFDEPGGTRSTVLCRAALIAGGLAADSYVASEESSEGDSSNRLRERMIRTAETDSKDSIGRVVSALAWYYPLQLAAQDPDRENQDVLPWLVMLHQGLHPVESLVVVVDEAMIMDLYERGPEPSRLNIGMTRWLWIHLGEPNPDPNILESMSLGITLVSVWPIFVAGLED